MAKLLGMFDRTLLKIKILYFVINVLVCSLHTYKTQYLMDVMKLTKAQVGFVYVSQCVMFAGSLAWSSLVDRRPTLNRPLSALCPLLYAVVTSLLLLKLSFWWVLVTVLLSYAMSSALFPLLDAQVMHMLSHYSGPDSTSEGKDNAEGQGRTELQEDGEVPAQEQLEAKKEKTTTTVLTGKMLFSRQRMWGAGGVAAATFLAYLSNQGFGRLSGMFLVMVTSSIVYSLLAILFLSAHPTRRSELEGRHASLPREIAEEERGHPIVRLLRMPLWLSFMLFILSAGYTRAAINIYLSFFLATELKLGIVSSTFAAAIRLVSELGIYFTGHVFTTVFGYHGVLLISQLAALLRILGYGHLDKQCRMWPHWALYIVIGLLELLKGVNSGLIVVGATKLASEMAPRGCEHTAQGMLTGVFVGLASALAGLISGVFLAYNPSIGSLFRWSGWLGVAMYAVFLTHFYFSGVLSKRPSPPTLHVSPDGTAVASGLVSVGASTSHIPLTASEPEDDANDASK